MRRKLLATLLLVAISSATFAMASEMSPSRKVKPGENFGPAPAATGKTAPQQDDEPDVINGAKNPELIPDHLAYSLLFRLVAANQDPESKKRIKNYVRQMGLGDCRCPGQDPKDKGNDKDIDAFIVAADEFQQRVSVLDQQAIAIKKNNWPNFTPAVMAQLTQLQRQKEALVAEVVGTLPKRLSTKGMEKVRKHVKERVKKNMKVKAKGEQADAPSLARPGANSSTD